MEIIRVLDALNDLKSSPDYELRRLTEKTPAFFDEAVNRHVETLENELATLQTQAEELAKEIEELKGRGGIRNRVAPRESAALSPGGV